jgi:thioredoxin reductase (NADPH)
LIESAREVGGQLHHVYNRIENYPGISAANGQEMIGLFLRSLEQRKFDLRTSTTVTSADLASLTVSTSDGARLSARSIVIATGVRRRKLGVAGEDEFFGKGIMTSGAKEADTAAGKNVLVIGGGDAAIENALILSGKAKQVTVVHRSEKFKARESFLSEAQAKPNVSFVTNHTIERFEGADKLEKVFLKDKVNDSEVEIKCDLALIRIGVEPNSTSFSSQLNVDKDGYIIVSSRCETSFQNVYAIGDVANATSLNISTAAGNAATAIADISNVIKREKTNPKI